MSGITTALIVGIVVLATPYLAAVPSAVRRHDRRVAERNDDLYRWVHDCDRTLQLELHQIDESCNRQNLYYSSHRLNSRVAAKELALHRYRDERIAAESFVAEEMTSEHLPHRLWRWVVRRAPAPGLTTPNHAAVVAIIASWEEPERDPYPDSWDAQVRAYWEATPNPSAGHVP